MGRSTQKKQAYFDHYESKVLDRLTQHNRKQPKSQKFNKKSNIRLSAIKRIESIIRVAERSHLHTVNSPQRSYEHWTPKAYTVEKAIIELFKYMYCKYKVKKQLINILNDRVNTDTYALHFDTLCILLAVGSGVSLFKLLKNNDSWRMTKKECHVFLNKAPHTSYGFNENAAKKNRIWAKAYVAGLPSQICYMISIRNVHANIWTDSFFQFLEIHKDKYTPDDLSDILDYLIRGGGFDEYNTFVGRSWDKLVTANNEWHLGIITQQKLDKSNQVFYVPDIKTHWTYTQKSKKQVINEKWTIDQCTTSSALLCEGSAMRHCVGAYARSCVHDSVAIYSVKHFVAGEDTFKLSNAKNAATVEVHFGGQFPVIRQCRSFANKPATSGTLRIIRLWAQKNGIRVQL